MHETPGPRRPLPPALVAGASMLAVALATAALYAPALGLAFFNDDPSGHFRWLEGLSLPQLFTTSAGYGFYRPLTFAAWKLLHALSGGYPAVAFHALPLALHAANAAMLWLLARSLSGRAAFAWAAALAFAAFPPSYEAVAYVAAMFHPLVTFFVLLTLLLYAQARRSGRREYLAGALVAALLALFAHENGVVVPVLLVAWELGASPVPALRQLARRPLAAFFLAPALFALLWQAVPKIGSGGLQPLPGALRNVPPFLQLAAYPLLVAARLSPAQTGALAGLALGSLAALYALAHLARGRRLFLFALVWLVAASLPSILLLEPAYVYGSPRLYYLASAGAALLWALPVLALDRLATGPLPRRLAVAALQAALIAAVILPPLPFVRCQLGFFQEASDLVRAMARLAASAPADREPVFVNVPFYFSSCPAYPAGCRKPQPFAPTGAVVIPPYANVRDFLRVNGGPDRPAQAVTFRAYQPGWNTHGPEVDAAALRSLAQGSQVYVFDLVHWRWFDLSGAWWAGGPAGQARARFGDLAELAGAGVERVGQGLEVTLEWRALKREDRPFTVFVHLYDAAGAVAAQHDGMPALGYVPTPLWQPGDRVRDAHPVLPGKPLAPGTYTLTVGWYDPATGKRLPARSPDGAALADDAYVVERVEWGTDQ